MAQGKLLTISIAAYNVALYLKQTLDSLIIDKNMDRLEVLIINDGSKDDTAAIAESYAEKYPDTFIPVNKENGGHGSTINVGLERASGKYFRVLDGDDWVDSGGLEELLDKLEETDADLVLTDRVNVYETGRESVRFDGQIPHSRIQYFSSLRTPVSVALSSISVKTRLLRQSGYRCREHCYYEDIEFDCYAIAVSESYVYYPIDLYQYRLGREGQSINPANLRRNIHMSCEVAEAVDAFYSENREKLSGGQRLCILDRAVLIHTQIIATYMTFKPDKKHERLLKDFLSGILSKEIRTGIIKNKLYVRLLCAFPGAYRPAAGLYRLAKRIKD